MSDVDPFRAASSRARFQGEYWRGLGVPDVQFPHHGDSGLDAHVIYTRHAATLSALSWVSRLGCKLGVRPAVLMFYVLPISLPLAWRFVPKGFLEGRVRALKESAFVDFSIRIYLCRSSRQSLRQILKPGSLVVVGGKRRWWPTDEQRLVARLRKEGHQAFLVE